MVSWDINAGDLGGEPKGQSVSSEIIDQAINDLSEDWSELQLEDKQFIIEVIDKEPAEVVRLVKQWLQGDIEKEAGETICANCLDSRGDIVELEEVTMPEKLEGVTVYYHTKICRTCGWES